MEKVKEAKLSELIQDDHNLNKGTERGQELIKKSMKKFGAGRSILIDKNNRIIAGNKAQHVFCTSPIDEFFDYCFGRLEYRSLRFEYEVMEKEKTQGCPVVNYCDHSVEYTRKIEHNLFTDIENEKIVVSYEYPQSYEGHADPYYPIPSNENLLKYEKYKDECKRVYNGKVLFGGRLGGYKYYAMDDAIYGALRAVENVSIKV